jgi:hypothetical protein
MEEILFPVLLFLIALLYASVGHGGASGYLALMAIFGVTPELMKPSALLLNVFVSLLSFSQFYRSGHFRWKLFLPFALASIPFSFLGGWLTVDAVLYKKILGFLLLIPIVRFLWMRYREDEPLRTASVPLSVGVGAGIGFLSGLIGIGGGILLSPVLLLLRWTNQKQTAAISALFIFVNSIAGLGGQLTKSFHFPTETLGWVVVAFIGGLIGAWLGARKFQQQVLQYVLAGVLLLAAWKLLFTSV